MTDQRELFHDLSSETADERRCTRRQLLRRSAAVPVLAWAAPAFTTLRASAAFAVSPPPVGTQSNGTRLHSSHDSGPGGRVPTARSDEGDPASESYAAVDAASPLDAAEDPARFKGELARQLARSALPAGVLAAGGGAAYVANSRRIRRGAAGLSVDRADPGHDGRVETSGTE